MYQLKLFYPGDPVARRTVPVQRASDVLARIPQLLEEHSGCEKVVVYLDSVRLFGVDCAGNAVD